MNIAHLITDPGLFIILSVSISLVVFVVKNFKMVNANLKVLIEFLEKFKKTDLAFRFGEFDKGMSENPYVANSWKEFRNTLVFSESVAIKGQDQSLAYENVSKAVSNIQTTVDPLYFFNEETLSFSKFNSKFLQAAPTLLTGMGPLFTFLNIAMAFSKVDFSTSESTIASISGLMSSMQVAALCSVFAVSASLIFILFEKLFYNKMCKLLIFKVQELMGALFDNISSEKFLIELLKETKLQNHCLVELLQNLPDSFNKSLYNSVSKTLVPYLENMLYGINTLNKTIKTTAKAANSGDAVDKLF